MARTESEILCRAPIRVVLGGKDCEIRILTIAEARQWRAQMMERFGKIWDRLAEQPPRAVIGWLFTDGFSVAADLFFAYVKDLDRQAVEASATEQELAAAIEEVFWLAFPFGQRLRALSGGLTWDRLAGAAEDVVRRLTKALPKAPSSKPFSASGDSTPSTS